MAAKKIGSSIVLEGAKEYNQNLKTINTNLKELRSELKLNQAEFATSQNSEEALSKKVEILSKQYEEAGKKVETYSKYLDEAREGEGLAREMLESYRTQLEAAKNTLNEYKTSGDVTNETIKAQEDEVRNLEQAVKNAETAVINITNRETQLETALYNAKAEELQFNNELEKNKGYLEEAANSTDHCAKSIDEFGNKIDISTEKVKDIDDQLNRLLKNEAFEKLGEAAEKMLDSLMECAEVAENFEYSIAKVQSIAKVSSSDLSEMSAEIRRVGAEMGYSANEVAEATYQAISASVDASEAIGFVEETAQLARAGFTELTTAIDVVTTATNAYGKEANTTAHIADDLITTQNLGKTTVDELAQSLGTIIPTASAYGVTLDQLSSAYVILTRNGVNTANATTYLRGMLNELADSSSHVAEIIGQETGHTFGELMKQGYSLGDVMQILGEEVDGNTEAFANLFGNIRAGQGALNIFNAGADEFNRILGEMENNAGATDEAFKVMADTAVMTNERWEVSIENLKIAIGESLSPTIERFKEIGIEALEPVTEFIEAHPELVSALAGAVTAIAGVTVAVTALATATAICKAVFGDWTGMIALAIGGIGVAGGIIGYAAATEYANQDVVDLTDSINENKQALKDEYDELKKLEQEQKTNSENVKALRERFSELTQQDITTAEVKKELIAVIAQLNEAIPGLNIAYEDLTTGIDGNTEAILSNIDALSEQSELEEKQAEMAELEALIAEATANRAEAEEALYSILEEKAELEEKQAEYLTEYGDLNYAVQNRIEELTEAEKAARHEKNESNHILDEATEKYGILSNAVSELSEAEKEETQSALEAEAAEEARQNRLDQINEKIREQIGLFEELEPKTMTLEEMNERLESQNKIIDQYNQDLQYMKEHYDELEPSVQKVVDEIAEMGTDGAGYLNTIVEAHKEHAEAMEEAGESTDELNDKWTQFVENLNDQDKLVEAKDGLVENYDEMLDIVDGYVETNLESQQLLADETEAITEGSKEQQLQTADELKTELENTTTEMMTNVTEIVKTNTETKLLPQVQTTCEQIITRTKEIFQIGEDNISVVYKNIGLSLTNGLAKGIEEGADSVIAAISSLAGRMESAINEALGALMG